MFMSAISFSPANGPLSVRSPWDSAGITVLGTTGSFGAATWIMMTHSCGTIIFNATLVRQLVPPDVGPPNQGSQGSFPCFGIKNS
jgi:hypothetical protein